MMQSHGTTGRKPQMLLSAGLFAVIWMVWTRLVGGYVVFWLKSGVMDMVGDITFLQMLLYLAIDVAETCLMLVVMHRVAFFSKRPVSILYPLMTCIAVKYAASYGAQFVQLQLDRELVWSLQASLRPYVETVFMASYIILPVLIWAVIGSVVREPRPGHGVALTVQSGCVMVAVLSAVSAFLTQIMLFTVMAMDTISLIFQWAWLIDAVGLLLVLLKGVYAEKQSDSADAEQESSAVFVSNDSIDVPDARETEEAKSGFGRFGRSDSDDNDRGFGLFGRNDFDNDERVIAQSSREAICVMEHNELEMKHEWNCDDDEKGHH